MVFGTLAIRMEGAAVFVEIATPPMNPLGPELVRDPVSPFSKLRPARMLGGSTDTQI